jgi:hypothetical protein
VRGARGVGVAEDVDAVALHLGERAEGGIERLRGRPFDLTHRLHEGEVVAALGVEESRPQVQVVPQVGEGVLEEALEELRLGAARLQRAEERVETAVEQLCGSHEST